MKAIHMPKSFTVRMPDNIHEKLTEWAEEEYRSINSLIISLLSKEIEQRAKKKEQQEKENADDK